MPNKRGPEVFDRSGDTAESSSSFGFRHSLVIRASAFVIGSIALLPLFLAFRASLFPLQFLELSNPDIAEADRVAVVHEHERQFFCMFAVDVLLVVGRLAADFGVVLHDDAV